MKRLYKLRLIPLLALVFLLPVHATESRIIEGSLRDQYFLNSLKERSRFDCCAPIAHRAGIHPHILDDCGLLVAGHLKKKALGSTVVPRDIYGLLVRYLAGDLDKHHFDKTCFVHNDTGAFIGWIPKASWDEGVYRIKTLQICPFRGSYHVKCSNILVCREFTTPYGRSGRDKYGYDNRGYDIDGYDGKGYDVDGYNGDGYDRWGYDIWGYDKKGYDEEGYNRDGYHKDGGAC